jgi:diacylglycerol kinase (ATP)
MRDWILAEIRRLGNTSRFSWQGWASTWAREKSLRQWAALNALSAVLAVLINLTGAERGLILALGLLILVAELFNSAIEETVDYISTDHDPRAGRAKDVGSAAVAVTALAWGVAWISVLIG